MFGQLPQGQNQTDSKKHHTNFKEPPGSGQQTKIILQSWYEPRNNIKFKHNLLF